MSCVEVIILDRECWEGEDGLDGRRKVNVRASNTDDVT
jgi:hypothetical protein